MTKKRRKKMQVKWVELTEDDPIFRRGFIISSPFIRTPKNKVTDDKQKKEIRSKRQNKKKGIKSSLVS